MLVKIINGKGGKDRLIPLPEKTLTLLEEYCLMQKPKNFLFLQNREHKPISRTTLHKMLKVAAKECGIKKKVHPHILRHSYATHLLEKGYDIITIQELLGHTNVQITMIYTHVATKHRLGVRSPLDDD